ncbi:Extracellular ligand-binding receptor [Beggiatoa sp. PS]|nr:Extracellular ligand-binding receptor [Beggiatoa sp. PS]
MKATYWIFSLIVILLTSFLVYWKTDFFKEEAIYIAVSGPMSGTSQPNGEAMVEGIQLYLDDFNRRGGIDGRPVKLLVYDDQNEAELATAKALEIATQSQALAVIGHYSSTTSLAASPIYKEYGVPAITGTATADALTKENDWYFRIIFNNSDQGALLAHYVRKILGYEEASILYDKDAYGSTLAEAFEHTAKKIGLSIKHQWGLDSAEPTEVKTTLNQMIATVKESKGSPEEVGMLFFAIHSTEAVQAITQLRRLGRQVPIIGADALSSNNFTEKLSQYPQERAQPGYYSDGIYTTSPLLFEIASEQAQEFYHNFQKEYEKSPAITSAMYYDAAMIAVDAIQKTLKQPLQISLENTRKQVRNNIWRLSRLENAIDGATGYLYFDEHGDAIKSIPIGVYENGKPTVAMRQYQPMTQLHNVDNLLQEVLDNKMLLVNGKFMSEASVVHAGIDFNDISELNLSSSTFTADFYLWFRFRGDFDDTDIEFINIFDPAKNQLGKPIVDQHSKENITTRTYRLKTQFKADFDFSKYPLDKQILPIYFRHNTLTRDKLIYVVDAQGMGVHKTGNQSLKKKTENVFSIGGWKIEKVLFFQDTQKNDSTLGIPELFNEQQRIEYSRFNSALEIDRHVLSFVLKNLLPVIFLIVLGYASFFIQTFPQKLALGTNMIVATSLFHLKLSSELREIDYIILIEYFFYLVYLLAIFTIAIAILAHLEADKEENANKGYIYRLNLFGRIVYPLFFFVTIR